jgi:hypothetical protein
MRGTVVVIVCAACGSAVREAPPEQQAAPMAAIVESQMIAVLAVGGRDPFSIVVACDLAPPQVTITRAGASGHSAVAARDCRAVWTAARAVAAGGDCAPARGACIDAIDHARRVHACCAPGASPLFDAAIRGFAIAAARTPVHAIEPARFDGDDVVEGELIR